MQVQVQAWVCEREAGPVQALAVVRIVHGRTGEVGQHHACAGEGLRVWVPALVRVLVLVLALALVLVEMGGGG